MAWFEILEVETSMVVWTLNARVLVGSDNPCMVRVWVNEYPVTPSWELECWKDDVAEGCMVVVNELSPTYDAVMQRNGWRDYPGAEIQKWEQ